MSVIIDIFVFFVIIDIRRWAYVSALIADVIDSKIVQERFDLQNS